MTKNNEAATWLRLMLLAIAVATLPACRVLDMRMQSVESRIKMHAGSPWVVGIARDLDPEAAAIYEAEFKDKEIYFTPTGVTVAGTDKKFDLQLVNKRLNCSPSENSPVNVCRDAEFATVDSGKNPTLQYCALLAKEYKINFVGVIGEKYCLHVALIERRDPFEKFPAGPTSIEHDRVAINIFDPEDGDKGPGVIPVKPRPNFRAPSVN